MNGITISVAVAGVHAYNNTSQFFEDSTYISKKSEGYIYANSYIKVAKTVTIDPSMGGAVSFSFISPTDLPPNGQPNQPYMVCSANGTYPRSGHTLRVVRGSYPLPTGMSAGVDYNWGAFYPGGYGCTGGYARGISQYLSTTGNGTATEQSSCSIDNTGSYLNNGDQFYFAGSVLPSGISGGVLYTAEGDGSYFRVTLGGTRVNLTDTGTNVVIFKPSDIVNPIDTGSLTPEIWLYGWDYDVLPDMTFCAIKPGSTPLTVSLSDTGTEVIMNDGTKCTKFVCGSMPFGSDTDYGGRGFLVSNKLWVNNKDIVYSAPTTLLVGEEPIPIIGSGNDTTHGNYLICDPTIRIMSNTLKSYPHDVGALVSKTNYTEASPQTGSPIDLYGLYIDNRTVDNNITYGQLDGYATSLLLGLGNFYKKATTWGAIILVYVPKIGEYYGVAQSSLQTIPRAGDRVSFTEYIGATPIEYQIVSVTTKLDGGTISLELGDFEKNVFTTLQQSTNAVNNTLT